MNKVVNTLEGLFYNKKFDLAKIFVVFAKIHIEIEIIMRLIFSFIFFYVIT